MQLDLSLLTALDALLDEGSVGGAADRLHVTSPAMSRTLNRIREATGDEILVRVGRHMTLTPHAKAIRGEVRSIVRQANTLLAPRRELDLSQLERTFTIQCHDAIGLALAGGLIELLQAQAPRVTLRLLAEESTNSGPGGVNAPNAPNAPLRRGEVDVSIGSEVPALPDVHHEVLAHDELVVALMKNHALTKSRMTVKRYADARHLIVSRRGRLTDPVDELLAQQGKRRHVVASSPNVATALSVVASSDLIVVVPKSASMDLIKAFGLATLPLPLDVSAPKLVCAWHRRLEADNAHLWLRTQLRAVAKHVFTGYGNVGVANPAR